MRPRHAHGTRQGRLSRIAVALLCAGVLAGAAAPVASAAGLQYFGGPIMHANTTVLVDWGSSVGSTYTSGDPGFLNSLAAQIGSPANVSGILAQYLDTSGQNYHAAAYDNQYAITPADSTTSVTDSQIQTELKAQVNAGHLPSPGGDGQAKLYVVLFPSGTTVCDSPGSCSGTTFCAYHGSTSLNGSTRILYAVMPDMTNEQGCQNDNTAFNSHTVILSHEWAEAINDPLVAEAGSFAAPLAWYDKNNGEIGDICNQQPASNGSIRVQKEFSNLDNNCVSTESAHYGSPTAAFPIPSSVVFGQQASFSGSGSSDPSGNHASETFNGQTQTIPSGIATYTWQWGDGTPDSTGVSPNHTFASAGTYNVTLTVKDNLGFSGAVTHQVTAGQPSGPVPTIITGSASGIGVSAATLNGTVNPNGTSVTYHFEYGTSSATAGNYDHSTADTTAGSGSSNQNVSADVSGLAAHTQYFVRLVGQVGSSVYPGQQTTFTTGSPAQPLPAPVASVLPASDVSAFAATLNGSVDPRGVNTTYHFDYGTSTSYGSSTPDATAGSGSGAVPVSYAIPSLASSTTYHYRVVATSAGGTVASPDQAFTTGAAPTSSGSGGPGNQPPVTQPPNVVVPKLTLSGAGKALSLTAALKHGLRYRFKCDRACTVTFTLTFQLPPGLARVATAVILAKGTAKLKSAGKGVVVLRFNRSGRKALAHKRTAKVVLTGTARDKAGHVSRPGQVKLVLRR